MSAVLATEGVECRFGGVIALADISLQIEEGQTVGLIGPSGAGKSTLLNCVTGYYRPSRGSIHVLGNPVVGSTPRRLCQLGVTRTFQNLALFERQTVRENVLFGAYLQSTGRGARDRRHAVRADLEQILDDLELRNLAETAVGTLPYPTRKRVEFGRALMSRPRLMLLDEPTSGMGIEDSRTFAEMLERAREQYELSLGIVAHDMAFVFRICHHVYVMDAGRVIFSGAPSAVRDDPEVRRVYLGER
jgi:branched-chain amino acid transport system ATP-binding protein